MKIDTSRMTDIHLENPIDGTELVGFRYTPKKPVAVMSLVHGFGEHCARYYPMAEYLAQQGIATVAIDLRGHGKSGGARGVCRRYEDFRTDVDALLSETVSAFPKLPHFLYGHSMGGGLVMNYMLERQPSGIRANLVSAPLLALPKPPPQILLWILGALRSALPNLTLSQPIKGDKVSTLPDEQAAYENDPLCHGHLGVGLIADMITSGKYVSQHARDWTSDILLMHARADQLTDFSASESFAAQVPSCEFHGLDNVEHEMHNDTSRMKIYELMATYMKARL